MHRNLILNQFFVSASERNKIRTQFFKQNLIRSQVNKYAFRAINCILNFSAKNQTRRNILLGIEGNFCSRLINYAKASLLTVKLLATLIFRMQFACTSPVSDSS